MAGDEKTCCDSCDMQCGEHKVRWDSVDKLDRDIQEMYRDINARRETIDKKLEIGVAKFASLENSMKIFMAVIALMFTVASIGYSKASSVEGNLSTHMTETAARSKNLERHIETHAANLATERAQEEEIHSLSEITKVTKETLKAIDQRLERIEKKM